MSAHVGGAVVRRAGRGPGVRVSLLLAGVAAVVVYALGDLISGGLLYDGYSFRDQAISELSAYGSPVRAVAVTWIALHNLLGIAFGVGIWRSAGASRALRWTAALLIAAAVVTAPLHPFFPMSPRGAEGGLNDTMHLVLTMAFGVCVLGAVTASAVALRGWFRLYAIVSVVVIVVFGALTGPLMSGLATGLPTPWLGGFERVNAYATFAWMVALAVVLARRPDLSRGVPTPEELSADGVREHLPAARTHR
ncbi:DUF998 domain-containing protein [Georgenia daeguensis]|uniref:DUF998 domain-containing protein n=1 Tax=Georgenia daeguensis TaxID=908355 RepID=A0ABP8EWE8_9MICO